MNFEGSDVRLLSMISWTGIELKWWAERFLPGCKDIQETPGTETVISIIKPANYLDLNRNTLLVKD